MRKLKLQVQMSVDGFIAGPNGEMDWLTFNWSDDLVTFVRELTASFDTIILGRKLAEGFIPHWQNAVSYICLLRFALNMVQMALSLIGKMRSHIRAIRNTKEVLFIQKCQKSFSQKRSKSASGKTRCSQKAILSKKYSG